jgi:hypothetical protein
MNSDNLTINLPLSFNQVVEIIRQLPQNEKLKLREFIEKETKHKADYDDLLTHYASEASLSKDWLLMEEEEAWKDL